MMPKKRPRASLFSSVATSLKTYIDVFKQDLAKAWEHVRTPELRLKVWRKVRDFVTVFYRRVIAEGILKEAASLTYITILGFIPFLMFVVMIAPDLPFLDLKDKLYLLVMNNFIPTSANAINNVLEGMLSRRTGFNVFSFAMMVVTSYSLFTTIRNTFDRILSMEFHHNQDLLSQLIKFLGTIILGLMIMVLLFSSSSLPIISRLLKLGIVQWLTYLLPFILQFLAFIFLYTLMPTTKVKRASLFRGAFWTTVIWVAVKSGFDFYIFQLTNLQAVYGVLAALPIFLMWIFVNWVIILGGIVLVSVLDNSAEDVEKKKQPKKMVRVSLEMYSDTKLNERLEKIFGKEDLMKLADVLDEEIE